MSDTVLVAIITAASTIIGTVSLYVFSRYKNKSDATQALTEAAVTLIEPLEKRLRTVEEELQYEREINRVYRQTLEEWRGGFDILDCQLRENGMTPKWAPSPIPEIPTRPRKQV